MRAMNPQWARSSESSIDKDSEHCAAWLCDPNEWTQYKIDGVAEYAIGCPSLEMYGHAVSFGGASHTCVYYSGYNDGYTIAEHAGGPVPGNWKSRNYSLGLELSNIFCYEGGLDWLASPSARWTNALCYVNGDARELRHDEGCRNLSGAYITEKNFACCPIVCLI